MLLADGTSVPIADVEVGDLVLAGDLVTGQTAARPVTDLIVGTGVKDLVDVTVAGAPVTATAGHPFWLPDSHTWVDAEDLRPGDDPLTATGAQVDVTAVVERTATLTVHNLTVADLHTYHALADDHAVLVHNQTSCAPSRPAPPERVVNDLRDYQSSRFQAGPQTFQLDRAGMTHILERHHPNYWNGTTAPTQTFCPEKTTVGDIQNIANEAMRQNRDTLIQQGTNAVYQIEAEVNGVRYALGINNGRIAQLYPRPPSP